MSRRGRIGGSRRTAFTITTTSEIQSAITCLYTVMQKTMPHPVLTHDEVLNMFAPPDVVAILKEAPVVGAVSYYYAENAMNYQFEDTLVISFGLNGDRGNMPLLPKVPKLQPGFDARAEEIVNWGKSRVDTAFEWGLVRRFFDRLNHGCKSGAQARYLWPALLGVMRAYGGPLKDTVARLEEFKRPPELPNFSQDFVDVGKRCTQIVATALIMQDVVSTTDIEVPVRLGVSPRLTTRLHTCEEIGSYPPASG